LKTKLIVVPDIQNAEQLFVAPEDVPGHIVTLTNEIKPAVAVHLPEIQ
jgi:hypothetical protein